MMHKQYEVIRLRTKLKNMATALVVLAWWLPHAAFAADTPAGNARQTIEKFHAALLTVMKQASTNGTKARYQFLEPEIAKRFDLRLMIALATGKHWRSADEDARDRLAAAFHRFSTATYASRFSGYSGQSFKTLEVTNGPRKTELVKSEITRPNRSPVALTYVTRRVPAGWRIVDLLVDDGISELAVRRSEYRAILKSDGVNGLIRLLDQKTAVLLQE